MRIFLKSFTVSTCNCARFFILLAWKGLSEAVSGGVVGWDDSGKRFEASRGFLISEHSKTLVEFSPNTSWYVLGLSWKFVIFKIRALCHLPSAWYLPSTVSPILKLHYSSLFFTFLPHFALIYPYYFSYSSSVTPASIKICLIANCF